MRRWLFDFELLIYLSVDTVPVSQSCSLYAIRVGEQFIFWRWECLKCVGLFAPLRNCVPLFTLYPAPDKDLCGLGFPNLPTDTCPTVTTLKTSSCISFGFQVLLNVFDLLIAFLIFSYFYAFIYFLKADFFPLWFLEIWMRRRQVHILSSSILNSFLSSRCLFPFVEYKWIFLFFFSF